MAEAVAHVQTQTTQYNPQYSQTQAYVQQPQIPQPQNPQQTQMVYQQYVQPQVMPSTPAVPQPQPQVQPISNVVTPGEDVIKAEPADVTPSVPNRPQGRYTF